jgi:D-glycero-beta-D-manno-heptose-7-phosphate kinase
MKDKLLSLLNNFKQKKILVIGDIMLDKYIFGRVSRVSPEAPVPIVKVEKEMYVPGGAANAASNITNLGAEAFLMGVVGEDQERGTLLNELRVRKINAEGIVMDDSRPTIQKTRVLSKNQQLLRVDYEKSHKTTSVIENKLITYLQRLIPEVDIIIISDYAKGLITANLMEEIKKLAKTNDKKVIVDPRPINKEFYKDVYLITPNASEAERMAKADANTDKEFEELSKNLAESLNSNIIITRGPKGMLIFENENTISLPTKAKDVYDVSGAGDTVAAVISLALAADATLEEAATLANHAAGVVVGKLGTATCSLDELKESIEND